jgi:hypothetical protein
LRQKNPFTNSIKAHANGGVAAEISIDPFALSGVEELGRNSWTDSSSAEHKTTRGALAIVNPASRFQFQRESF